MIAILNGESSDMQRLKQAFDHLGIDAQGVDSADRLERASGIVLPENRSFSRMIRSLRDLALIGPLLRAAADGRPILGISHGMHLLLDVSFEEGQHTGLGLVHGSAARFDLGEHPAARHFSIPHQGWSQVNWTGDCPLTAGLRSGEPFYFDHAYHAEPLDHRVVHARCNHGIDFSAVIWKGRVFGIQFLPEKSEDAGLKVLANFGAL
jgi:glutamine amidotransferase